MVVLPAVAEVEAAAGRGKFWNSGEKRLLLPLAIAMTTILRQ